MSFLHEKNVIAGGFNAAGPKDGPLHEATFGSISAACNDSNGNRLILLEPDRIRLVDFDQGLRPLVGTSSSRQVLSCQVGLPLWLGTPAARDLLTTRSKPPI